MTRSTWKGPFCEITKKQNKIWSRRSMILPQFVGKQLSIHNGKTFLSVKILPEMVGQKVGEFANTRKKPIHKKKQARKRG